MRSDFALSVSWAGAVIEKRKESNNSNFSVLYLIFSFIYLSKTPLFISPQGGKIPISPSPPGEVPISIGRYGGNSYEKSKPDI
jgi:hypothetical protein